MRPSPRLGAVAALATLLLAAGCGGDDGDGGDSNFAKQSGTKIAEAAKADMGDLEQVKYSGEIATADSQVSLDIQASSSGDCTGTIGLGEGTAEVLAKDGDNWFRPDEAFWRAQAPDQADAIIAAVGDKWVLDTDANFAQFCDLDAFLDNILTDDESTTPAEYEVTGTDEIDGEEVVKVERTTEDGPTTGFVLVDGEHYLVKLERTNGEDTGALEFSDFDEEFEVEAPAADEVADLDALSGA